ncbi:MAG: PDDEXK nuclease domain-containing protein [Candidatus Cloacimonadales bacterium]|nr:PDDEXK nuclease domain-containing protein [Candidatus Cloacimonadales bacterium]
MNSNNIEKNIFHEVKELIITARSQVIRSINSTMVCTYFEIGRIIVEHLQGGEKRAEYGEQILEDLSEKLIKEFGRGFSVRNLEQMKFFYLTYSIPQTMSAELEKKKSSMLSRELQKQQTVSGEFEVGKTQTSSAEFILSWSHYVFLMRIENFEERKFYEIEAHTNNWSLRELKRQFDSALYERLVLSKDKEAIKELSQKGQIISKPADAVKEPYILEFLGLPEHAKYSESDLESRLIDKLEHFLLELGKGFTFVARQKRMTFKEKHFFIDLVFYNRLLRCFVIIDLKIGELRHQDLGQMQMYVNYYDREIKMADENKTIGIILCKQKENALVRMTLPEDNEQIFASKYKTILPDKQQLKELIEENDEKGNFIK